MTLSWNNGEGLTFELLLSIDDNYMFAVEQRVQNDTGAPVSLTPWARIRRDYKPEVSGYYILFEGLLGVVDGTLQETNYAKAKTEGDKRDGIAFDATSEGGWAGITDKYWLTSLIPDQSVTSTVEFRHIEDAAPDAAGNRDHYQVDYAARDPQTVAAGSSASVTSHFFAGAKVVSLLDQYERQ